MSIIQYEGRYYNLQAIPIIRKTIRRLKYTDGSKRDVQVFVLQPPPSHYGNELVVIPMGTSAYTAIDIYIQKNLLDDKPKPSRDKSLRESSSEEKSTALTETEH